MEWRTVKEESFTGPDQILEKLEEVRAKLINEQMVSFLNCLTRSFCGFRYSDFILHAWIYAREPQARHRLANNHSKATRREEGD
jgi:hypothetical protein